MIFPDSFVRSVLELVQSFLLYTATPVNFDEDTLKLTSTLSRIDRNWLWSTYHINPNSRMLGIKKFVAKGGGSLAFLLLKVYDSFMQGIIFNYMGGSNSILNKIYRTIHFVMSYKILGMLLDLRMTEYLLELIEFGVKLVLPQGEFIDFTDIIGSGIILEVFSGIEYTINQFYNMFHFIALMVVSDWISALVIIKATSENIWDNLRNDPKEILISFMKIIEIVILTVSFVLHMVWQLLLGLQTMTMYYLILYVEEKLKWSYTKLATNFFLPLLLLEDLVDGIGVVLAHLIARAMNAFVGSMKKNNGLKFLLLFLDFYAFSDSNGLGIGKFSLDDKHEEDEINPSNIRHLEEINNIGAIDTFEAVMASLKQLNMFIVLVISFLGA